MAKAVSYLRLQSDPEEALKLILGRVEEYRPQNIWNDILQRRKTRKEAPFNQIIAGNRLGEFPRGWLRVSSQSNQMYTKMHTVPQLDLRYSIMEELNGKLVESNRQMRNLIVRYEKDGAIRFSLSASPSGRTLEADEVPSQYLLEDCADLHKVHEKLQDFRFRHLKRSHARHMYLLSVELGNESDKLRERICTIVEEVKKDPARQANIRDRRKRTILAVE